MYIPSFPSRSNSFSRLRRALLGLVLLAGIVGCGGSGSSSDEDPSGLYTSGTGTLNGNGVSDIIAFVFNNRIIAFSITADILIDGAITNIDDNEYTASVDVYIDGVLDQSNVAVSGFVTEGSSISGTGVGNFSITFDLLYNRGATGARISTDTTSDWAGPILMVVDDVATNNFGTANNATTFNFTSSDTGANNPCLHTGVISIPDASVNIYSMSVSISDPIGFTCDDPSLIATDYSGFAAVVDDGGTDNTLLYAVTNSSRSVFAVLTR